MRGYPPSLLLLGSFTLACMGGGTDDDVPAPDDVTRPNGPYSQPEICAEYLACVAVATPEELTALQDAYGEGGDCWTRDQAYADNCEASCTGAVADVAAKAPFEAACTEHLPAGCYATTGKWDFSFTPTSGERCEADFPVETFDQVLRIECDGEQMNIGEVECSSDKLNYSCFDTSWGPGDSAGTGLWYETLLTLTLDSAGAAHGTLTHASETCSEKAFQVTATKR